MLVIDDVCGAGLQRENVGVIAIGLLATSLKPVSSGIVSVAQF